MKKHQIALLVLLSVAAAITVACGNSSNPVYSNMAVNSDRNGSTGTPLFTMSVGGSSVTPVSIGTTDIWGPSVSADFKTVTYVTDGEVWSISPAGGTPTQLSQNAANNTGSDTAEISPNGQKIVYPVFNDSVAGASIWIMNADGSGSTNLTPTLPAGMTYCYVASFSADSSRIVFACTDSSTVNFALYTMKIDGTQVTNVLTQSTWLDTPYFTPNGKQILYTTFGTPGDAQAHKVGRTGFRAMNSRAHPDGTPVPVSNSGIASVNIDGSNPIILLPATNLIDESVILNSNLYYTVLDPNVNKWQIYKANLDGTGSVSISDGTADDLLSACGFCYYN